MAAVYAGTEGSVLEKPRARPQRPPLYAVVMYNDDFTPADFVVDVLVSVFRLDREHAVLLMMEIHNSGRGVCGTYPKDVAETKHSEAMEKAKKEGHPLRLECMPEH